MNKLFIIVAVALAALAVGAAVGYAITLWNQPISWQASTNTFTVWDAETGGNKIPSAITLELGVAPPPQTITYWIQNDGTAEIQVTGNAATASGIVTKEWTPTTPTITVPVGSTRTLLTLALSNFSPEGGLITVTLTSTP